MDRQDLLLRRAGVEIRENVEVTTEYAKSVSADVIIAAIGARPVKPTIPGIDGYNVMSAENAYINTDKIGDKVVIISGGLTGTELGVYLAMLGKTMKIIEMLPEMSSSGNPAKLGFVVVEMNRRGVSVDCDTTALKITDNGLHAKNLDRDVFYEADTIIYSVGMDPLFDEANSFNSCAHEFHQIGDCYTARNIQSATMAGFTAARMIGRI